MKTDEVTVITETYKFNRRKNPEKNFFGLVSCVILQKCLYACIFYVTEDSSADLSYRVQVTGLSLA